MIIRTFKYTIKEGFFNAYRNKLMSFASISIIAASLLIFGIFYILVQNLNYNAALLKQQPQVEVFCDPELDDAGVDAVKRELEESPMIREFEMVTKGDAYEKLRQILDDSQDLLEGLEDNSFLPVSFIVKLFDPSQSELFAESMYKVTGVVNVKYVQETIDIINRIANWTQIVSMVILTLLLVMSVFIIANTIKLALFSRRKEIGIMKYIGATDWFIRWPFVIEGVIIGLAGAIIAFAVTGYGYDVLLRNYNDDAMFTMDKMLRFIDLDGLWIGMAGWFLLVGILVGASGSLISIRRYLRV